MGCCWWSVKCGVLRLFLTRGADVFLKNREGETPPDCCSHNSKAWAALQANRRERQDAKNDRLTAEEKLLHRLKWYSAWPVKKNWKGLWGLHMTVDIGEKKCSPGRSDWRTHLWVKGLSNGKTLQLWPWLFIFILPESLHFWLWKQKTDPDQHLLCLFTAT